MSLSRILKLPVNTHTDRLKVWGAIIRLAEKIFRISFHKLIISNESHFLLKAHIFNMFFRFVPWFWPKSMDKNKRRSNNEYIEEFKQIRNILDTASELSAGQKFNTKSNRDTVKCLYILIILENILHSISQTVYSAHFWIFVNKEKKWGHEHRAMNIQTTSWTVHLIVVHFLTKKRNCTFTILHKERSLYAALASRTEFVRVQLRFSLPFWINQGYFFKATFSKGGFLYY